MINSIVSPIIRKFDADALLEKAAKKTGLNDYGDSAFEAPFRLLIQAMNEEAQLSAKGRLMARADLVKLLVNRLRMVRDRQQISAIAQQPISRPIFILGFPRTGSSFLHNLLAQDPQLQVPRYWESLYPSPPPAADLTDPSIQKRVASTESDFRWFNRINPKYKRIYQYGAQAAAECIALMATSFESLRFAFTYRVPTYRQWAEAQPLTGGYQFHKQYLQHLQLNRCNLNAPTLRWVLKAPAHLLHLQTLLETYPDAVVVFTHRHPSITMPSIASNTYTLRCAFSNAVDPLEVGQEELHRWQLGWMRSHSIRQQWPQAQRTYLDIYYDDLRRSPRAVIEALYQQTGLSLTDQTREKMEQFVGRNPKDALGKHAYTLEQFGLSEPAIEQAFASYLAL